MNTISFSNGINDVLVLNKHWCPIRIVSLEDAIGKVFSGTAEILGKDHNLYDWEEWISDWSTAKLVSQDYINTSSISILKPKAIVLKNYKGYFFRKVKLNRHNIFKRDGWKCQYCGHTGKNLNIDHILPVSRGGKMIWENVVISCLPCNQFKGNRTPAEAGMVLLSKPVKPNWMEIYRDSIEKNYRHWKDLIGDLYWTIELKD